MPRVDVNQPFDLFGLFWVPDKDERRIPGRLYRTPDGIRIQLFEDLRPGPTRVPRHEDGPATVFEEVPAADVDTPLTIHGQIGDLVGPITAYECVTMRLRSSMFGHGPGEYILAPEGVIFGWHTSGARHQFCGVRVRTKDVGNWVGLTGFAATKAGDGTKALTYKAPEFEAVQLAAGGALSVKQNAYFEGLGVRGGSLVRHVWLQVDDLPPQTWQEIDSRMVTPLLSLISLCLGEENKLTAVQLAVESGQWVDLATEFINSAAPGERQRGTLAGLPELGLAGVGSWLDIVERLGPLPPVVAHFSSKRATSTLETELLEMTTVAEGLHARLFPEARRFDDAQCEQIRTHVLEAVEGMDSRVGDVLRGMLTHLGEPGYVGRLKELAQVVANKIPGICGNISKWAAEVSRARNMYAHRTADFLDEGNIDALVTVVESLRWLLRSILLLEAGLPIEVLADRLQQMSGYRLFCERAAENLPRVYQPSSPA